MTLLLVSWEATLGKERHTVLVMPSVNRTNSMLLPGPSQSGLRVRISLRADDWESAWLYDRGMYRNSGVAALVSVEPMLELSGAEVEKGVWGQVGLGVGIILYYLISPQLLERHRLCNSDDILNSRFRQLHTSRLLAQCANGEKIGKK